MQRGLRQIYPISGFILLCMALWLAFKFGAYYQMRVRPHHIVGLPNAVGAPAEPAGFQHRHRIVFLGDSITALGDLPNGFATLLRDYLLNLYPGHKLEIINAGVPGDTSQQMLDRFDHDVLSQKPDLVFVMAGLNDIRLQVSAKDYARNLASIAGKARAGNIPVVFISSPITGEYPHLDAPLARECNNIVMNIARDYDQHYLDICLPLNLLIKDYRQTTGATDYLVTVDGAHLSSTGNLVLTNMILSELGISPESRSRVWNLRDANDI